MAVYLGLDSSTQSLTALAIESSSRKILGTWSVNFAQELPHWKTENGVLPADDPRIAHSPPLMWVEALDLVFRKMADDDFPFAEVEVTAGSGQQHGSVYLAKEAQAALSALPKADSLGTGLKHIFTRSTSPIWMDSSTEKECFEITEALGGTRAIAELTGSAAFERFTGPQIRKFYLKDEPGYHNTWQIHLVSSFMASVLAGKPAPIDPGDGAGMNLMDIKSCRWSDKALDATAPGLGDKLPPIARSDTVFAVISPYFTQKYGFRENTQLLPWSGDNPNSLIGVGLVEQGKAAISLGTSDTYFGFMPEANVDPAAEGHLFGSPTSRYMSLICFKNGSLAREKIAKQFNMNWARFSKQLEADPPGNRGRIMLPYFEPEITPKALEAGVRRYQLADDDPANVRAVIEAQAMSMAIHSEWMGVATKTIYATGGASENRAILQVLADVHGADVYQFSVSASAALGAALRAYHGGAKADGEGVDWPDVVKGFAEPKGDTRITPREEFAGLYSELKKLYREAENHALRNGADPTEKLKAFASKYQ